MTQLYDVHRCAICLQPLLDKGLQNLSCGHSIHEVCVLRMRRYGVDDRCPLCRTQCTELAPIPKLQLDAVMTFLQGHHDQCRQVCTEIKGIQENHPLASALLGDLFFTGRGVAQDFDKALELATVAHNGNVMGGTILLAQLYLKGFGGDDKLAFQLANRASKSGDPEGECLLAHMFYYGRGVQEDEWEAFELASRAHSKGSLGGTALLAQMYFDGTAPESNPEEAFELADQLHRDADRRGTYILAQIYFSGFGAEKDEEKAMMLARRAKDAGILEAGEFITMMLGLTVIKQAHEDCGHALATCLLAFTYAADEDGLWVKRDTELASKFLASSQHATNPMLVELHRLLHLGLDGECGSDESETDPLTSVAPYVIQLCGLLSQLSGCRGAHARVLAFFAEGDIFNLREVCTRCQDLCTDLLPQKSAHPFIAQFKEHSFVSQHVILLEVKRTPKELRKALLTSEELKEPMLALEAAGFNMELQSGAKLFVHPHQYQTVLHAVRDMGLKPRHIVVAEDYEQVVQDVIARVGQQAGVKRKTNLNLMPDVSVEISAALGCWSDTPRNMPDTTITTPEEPTDMSQRTAEGAAEPSETTEFPIEVRRTFIHISIPSSLLSGTASSVHPATW